ncbi:hypothetical protein MTBLM5_660001 [Magnetospirillum sp. LM-5]|nr:hypothetical protein MTBLM5_660001 [Magnetospirillum sp. LM-5]
MPIWEMSGNTAESARVSSRCFRSLFARQLCALYALDFYGAGGGTRTPDLGFTKASG